MLWCILACMIYGKEPTVVRQGCGVVLKIGIIRRSDGNKHRVRRVENNGSGLAGRVRDGTAAKSEIVRPFWDGRRRERPALLPLRDQRKFSGDTIRIAVVGEILPRDTVTG